MKILLFLQYFILLASSLWLLLLSFSLPDSWRDSHTLDALTSIQEATENFQSEFARLPQNLGELRIFALSQGLSFSPYDHNGKRLLYQPLSTSEFVIHSYSSSASRRSLSKLHWHSPKAKPLFIDHESHTLSNYSPANLLGSASKLGPYYARLVYHEVSQKRHIVIARKSDHSFVHISPHDGIEEFLWLPSGKQLVYTAFRSSRYRDGVFIWDLSDNSHTALINEDLPSLFKSDSKQAYASLSHIDSDSYIHFFYELTSDGQLDPGEFYKASHLKVFGFIDKKWTDLSGLVDEAEAIFSYSHDLSFIKDPSTGRSLQKEWLNLPLSGPITSVIDNWQQACAKNARYSHL